MADPKLLSAGVQHEIVLGLSGEPLFARRVCPHCGAQFDKALVTVRYELGKGKLSRFCSIQCSYASRGFWVNPYSRTRNPKEWARASYGRTVYGEWADAFLALMNLSDEMSKVKE